MYVSLCLLSLLWCVLAGSLVIDTAASPSKEKGKSQQQRQRTQDMASEAEGLNISLASESSLSSPGASRFSSESARTSAASSSKSGCVYVIRPRRTGLGKKNVKKKVCMP
jgi:hypothetical protein